LDVEATTNHENFGRDARPFVFHPDIETVEYRLRTEFVRQRLAGLHDGALPDERPGDGLADPAGPAMSVIFPSNRLMRAPS